MIVTKPFRVLIADKMSPKAAEVLSASSAVEVVDRAGISPEDLAREIATCQGLLVRSRTKVTADIIGAGEALEIIGRAGIGVDNIDLKAASRRGILVENAPSGNAVTTAEHAVSLLMALARNIPQATASMKAGKWEKNALSGVELCEKTVGVIGLGNIGRIVADRLLGLRTKVIAYDPFIGAEAAERLGVELVKLDELFARADIITCHTPLTAETKGIVGKESLTRAKDGVLIVNASRGGVVDEDALLAALESGKVGGAALDVFVAEPPPKESPLVAHPKVICTPHLGASTDEAQEKVAVEVAQQIVDYAERGEVRNAVNAPAVKAEVLPKIAPWLELCRELGALVAQLSRGTEGGFIDELSVELIGEPGELDAKACTRSALVGVLRPLLDVPINEVNAMVIAGDRDITVTEVKKSKDRDLTAAVGLRARCGDTTRFVRGTVYHVVGRVETRLLQVDDFLVETSPRGRILAVTNENRPGVIGKVGTLLGDAGVNVNNLHVGLDRERGIALALWNVDPALPEGLLDTIRGVPLVASAQLIEL